LLALPFLPRRIDAPVTQGRTALRIALTGATGFAGGPILAELLARGHHVAALVREPAQARLPETVRPVRGRLNNPQALQDLILGADVVVHVAGAISALSAREFMDVNRDGAVAVAQTALASGVKRMVFVSSLAAREPGLSPYAASKRAAEEMLQEIHPLGLVTLRPAAIYGERDKATLPLFRELLRPVAAIPGRRNNRFSLIHAADFARVVAEAAEGDREGTFEVDDGAGGHSWDDLAAVARGFYGRPARVVFLPRALPMLVAAGAEGIAALRRKPSMITMGKIGELYHPDWVTSGPGWPRARSIGLAEGLSRTFDWYMAQGWLPQRARIDRTPGQTTNGHSP
jgi:nucleoside-diphosphate-sugar epimerase